MHFALWQIPTPVQRRFYNCATPIVNGQTVIYSGQGEGTKAVAIEQQGTGFTVKNLWNNPELGTGYNTPILKEECDQVGIHYFSSPYDFGAVDMLEPYVPAYKIGSGDITWIEMLRHIAKKGLPVILATGAASIEDVQRAVDEILAINTELILMQCNTNYTASLDNFDHIHLNVLKTYASLYPECVLGLSDHTPKHATVLGGVALGARVVEKHFTDDNTRIGPDHPFSMDPVSWREMVDRTRELERALGSPNKRVAENEAETMVVQQRCLRAALDIQAGDVFSREMIDVLRPAPDGAIRPYEIESLIGKKAIKHIPAGAEIRWAEVVE